MTETTSRATSHPLIGKVFSFCHDHKKENAKIFQYNLRRDGNTFGVAILRDVNQPLSIHNTKWMFSVPEHQMLRILNNPSALSLYTEETSHESRKKSSKKITKKNPSLQFNGN